MAKYKLDRRAFLSISGATALSAGLPGCHLVATEPERSGAPKLGNWQDLYRQRWTWDSVTKGSHGWLNCRSACNFDIYVKDGVVVREEQAANYEASEPSVPDFNPRGCQKGGCYTEVMYGATRLTTPMKRAGARGEGKWRRISWEQAIEEIAAKLVDISERHGPQTIVHDLGPHFDYGATTAARNRFFAMMGAARPDDWAEIGDLNIGATLTLGMPHIGGSSDEWFLSDFLVVWMMNPSVTQIPDAHFLYEARYNGAQLTVIDPIYSATAIHADHWLPLKPGTDAGLALATARHIWESGRIDLEYVREQTDFPVLVRLDTGRFLRESDFVEGGRDDIVYIWDPARKTPVPAPGCEGDRVSKLALNGVVPPIEGVFQTKIRGGVKVSLSPVGALVKEQLDAWTFERAAALTGLSVEAVKTFAEGFAAAKRPMILSSWGSNRYFHSDQMNRAKLLCLSLKGAIGKEKGAGYHSTGWIGMEGFGHMVRKGADGPLTELKGLTALLGDSYTSSLLVDKIARRKSAAQVDHRMAKSVVAWSASLTNSGSQNYNHQGIKDVLAKEENHLFPRKLDDYVQEAQAKDWTPVCPAPDHPPRAWITGGSNVLRRSNQTQRFLDHLWPKLELVVDINQKNTFTGLHADYLLPAAGYYEKPGVKYSVAYIPYLHYCGTAVKPVGQAKDEWEIFHLLAQAVQRIARERGTGQLAGCGGTTVTLKTIADRYSHNGAYGPDAAEKVTREIIKKSPSAKGASRSKLKKKGVSKFVSVGAMGIQENLYNSDWKGEGVLQAMTDFVRHKISYMTLTGRQQYYIDHPWFLEAGEALPTHIDSPKAGGDYPFQLISCHSRWSVHSVWRDTPMLLRLQRGEPALYLNPADAAELSIGDGEWAELSNDLGKVRMRVKLSTMVRPKVGYYFHAWEPHQFPDHKSYKFITPGLIHPLHFAGGYGGQLGFFFGHFEPGTHVQDTRVAIRPWRDVSAAS